MPRVTPTGRLRPHDNGWQTRELPAETASLRAEQPHLGTTSSGLGLHLRPRGQGGVIMLPFHYIQWRKSFIERERSRDFRFPPWDDGGLASPATCQVRQAIGCPETSRCIRDPCQPHSIALHTHAHTRTPGLPPSHVALRYLKALRDIHAETQRARLLCRGTPHDHD